MAPAESRIVQDGTASTCPLQQLLWPPATSLQLQYVLFSTPTKQTSTSSSSLKKWRYYVKVVYFWVDFLPPAPTLHTARPIRLQHGPVGAPALRNHTAQPIRLQASIEHQHYIITQLDQSDCSMNLWKHQHYIITQLNQSDCSMNPGCGRGRTSIT